MPWGMFWTILGQIGIVLIIGFIVSAAVAAAIDGYTKSK